MVVADGIDKDRVGYSQTDEVLLGCPQKEGSIHCFRPDEDDSDFEWDVVAVGHTSIAGCDRTDEDLEDAAKRLDKIADDCNSNGVAEDSIHYLTDRGQRMEVVVTAGVGSHREQERARCVGRFRL